MVSRQLSADCLVFCLSILVFTLLVLNAKLGGAFVVFVVFFWTCVIMLVAELCGWTRAPEPCCACNPPVVDIPKPHIYKLHSVFFKGGERGQGMGRAGAQRLSAALLLAACLAALPLPSSADQVDWGVHPDYLCPSTDQCAAYSSDGTCTQSVSLLTNSMCCNTAGNPLPQEQCNPSFSCSGVLRVITASGGLKCVHAPDVPSGQLELWAMSLYNDLSPVDASYCGDGVVTGLEQCEPPTGGTKFGCSSQCTVEAGFTCPIGSNACTRNTCGNSVIDAEETCDDGNQNFDDGCSGWCTVYQGWYCTQPGQPCLENVCGDAYIMYGESCDDGNTISGDGCSSTCGVEQGFTCVGQTYYYNSQCTSSCGDGVKASNEACDDGNGNNDDGCSSSCTVEPGFACSVPSGTVVSQCSSTCADGTKAADEPCDDGNTASGDGCSSSCTIEVGWSCSGNPSSCSQNCGDGTVQAGEECDDGNTGSGDGCSYHCQVETGYSCTGAPSQCTSVCGDGTKSNVEACDDGNKFSGDGCSATCTAEPGFSCVGTSPNLCSAICGDGISNRKLYTISPPTNVQLNDAYYLSAGCNLVPPLTSQQDSVAVTINSVVDTYRPNTAFINTHANNPADTLCTFLSLTNSFDWSPDNGATFYLGSSTWSQDEFKWFSGSNHRGGFVSPSLQTLNNQTQVDAWLARMGNRAYANQWGFDYFQTWVNLGGCCSTGATWGQQLTMTVKLTDSTCEDGNTDSSDGCSSTCSVETGWTCPETGACSPICGDGLLKGPEECDDGNTFSMDGCSPTCHNESNFCGDGILNSTLGELCDDGNQASADGCSATCSLEPGWTCSSPASPCCTVSPNATRSTFAQISAETTANSLWFHTGPLRCHFLPPFGPDTVVTLQSATHTDYFRPRPSALSPVTTGTISACDFFQSNSKHQWSPGGTTYYQGMLGGSTATEFQYSTDPSTLGGSHPTTDPAWLAIFANRSQIPFWGLENSPLGHPYNISVTYGLSDAPCPTSAPTTTPAPTSTPAATQSPTTTPASTQTPTPTPTQTLLAPSTPSPAAAPAPLPAPLLALAAALIAALLLGSQ